MLASHEPSSTLASSPVEVQPPQAVTDSVSEQYGALQNHWNHNMTEHLKSDAFQKILCPEHLLTGGERHIRCQGLIGTVAPIMAPKLGAKLLLS